MKTKNRAFRLASIGGTFGAFHIGHQEYINLAFSLAENVQICINDSAYAQPSKQYTIAPLEERLNKLTTYIGKRNFTERTTIIIYHQPSDFHDALLNPEVDCVIILDEYYGAAQKINLQRKAKKLPEYHILIKPRTTINGDELSSTKLHTHTSNLVM